MRAHVVRMKDSVLEVLLFSVGNVRYGVPLSRVLGLVQEPELDPLGPKPGTPQVVLFEGCHVPVLPAHDFLHDIGPRNGRPREIIVLDDASGPFGIFVDATHSVVEIAAGDELYMLPPGEDDDRSPRAAWGIFTFAERPVMLLDLARTSVH
jgi:chemotaxis signal transduction protein